MNTIKDNMEFRKNFYNEYACLDENALYLESNTKDIRTPFYRDIDRIIYTLAFIRYSDKTQVFTFKDNDHLSKRMLHAQYVSKIARTIGRALGLNEDLIEAASLGHDLGHTPFGHVGEKILNNISLENNEGYFNHNIHSVRLLLSIENFGLGKNITIQTLDAIMCHNGELALKRLEPKEKTIEDFFHEYQESYYDKEIIKKLRPMTLEGCVVRISDLIAYIGRDIEDGIRLKLISIDDIPENIVKVLGKTNKEIVNTITLDIINNSIGKNYIELSEEVFKAILDLKNFNYKNIYEKACTEEERKNLEDMLRTLFKKYMEDLKENNEESNIIKSYLNNMSLEYRNKYSNERIVIDYLAGMTDDYCLKEYNKYLKTLHNKKEV